MVCDALKRAAARKAAALFFLPAGIRLRPIRFKPENALSDGVSKNISYPNHEKGVAL